METWTSLLRGWGIPSSLVITVPKPTWLVVSLTVPGEHSISSTFSIIGNCNVKHLVFNYMSFVLFCFFHSIMGSSSESGKQSFLVCLIIPIAAGQ